MARTFTFVFSAEPEGGFTVTCPALPGLVTYGETLAEARDMARDAMDGLLAVMLEMGEPIPESDPLTSLPRFNQLVQTLHDEARSDVIIEQLTAEIAEAV